MQIKTPLHILEYQKNYRKKNRAWISEKQRLKRHRRVLKAIELLGGKCNSCHGIFDVVCYDFHHLDPSKKEFTIAENKDTSEEKFFSEIEKCILLCANCHRLLHKVHNDTQQI